MNQQLQQIIDTLLDACSEISELLRQGKVDDTRIQNSAAENSSGEQQKPLDIISNELIKTYLQKCPAIYALSSEEEENAIIVHTEGEYLISFDPLDGSSNIDVNMCVGTIFSILKKLPKVEDVNKQFLQKGKQQVAAGFVVYGPATTAIIGVSPKHQKNSQQSNLFEIRLDGKEWNMVRDDLQCPIKTQEYAINASNYPIWDAPIREYIDHCLKGEKGKRRKNFNMRWLGSMVADMYRIFKRGGVFIYPRDARNPNGKIRLLYEANPMAFLIDLAGGGSTNGKSSVLDIAIQNIHQKTPVMIGSKEEIKCVEKQYKVSR